MRQKRANPTLFWPLAFLKRPVLCQLPISILAKSERSCDSAVLNCPRDISHSVRRCYWRRSVPGHGPGPRSELAQFEAESGERREERGARSVIPGPGRVNNWAPVKWRGEQRRRHPLLPLCEPALCQ